MAKFKLTETAKAKLKEIYRYTHKTYGAQQANAYLSELENCFHGLAKQPGLGRQFLDLRRYNYHAHAIFYEPYADGILILHIFHQSEDILTKLQ